MKAQSAAGGNAGCAPLEVSIITGGRFDGVVYSGISTAAGHVTVKMNAVAEAVESQTVSISQVTVGIDQISSVVQNASTTSEQSAATSQELSNQSQLMNELVRKFQLN